MPIKVSKHLQSVAVAFLAILALAGTAVSRPSTIKIAKKPPQKAAINNPTFHKDLMAIAEQYKNYGKVDDMARWAPGLCAAPPPPKLRLSTSADSGTHGKKMYFLYAKDRNQYYNNEAPQPGQAIVKESWLPTAEGATTPSPSDKQSDLFIMTMLDAKTPGTDAGWVYGTVTPDGKTVTSAGRVESCMGCHISAPHDRLFGMAPSNAPVAPNK